jgi:hypothetical protein
MTTFGDLRSLLHRPAPPAGWDELCALLDALPAHEHEPALRYIEAHLRLPDPALRLVPEPHIIAFLRDQPHPIHALSSAMILRSPTRATLLALATSAQLARLTHLSLHDIPFTGDDSDADLFPALLARTHLRCLAIEDSPLRTDVARAIAQADTLDALESLTLRGVHLGAEAARALARAQLPALRALSFGRNPLGRGGVSALLGWSALELVERLELGSLGLEDNAVARLVATPLTHLQNLDLDDNLLGNTGLARLLTAPWSGQLKALRLTSCRLGPEAIRALTAVDLPRLDALNLDDNPIGDEGADLLCASHLPASLRLHAARCQLSTDRANALIARFPHASLTPPDHTPG